MKKIHEREKRQFIALFRNREDPAFSDRLSVLEAFLETERHVTARELAEQLAQSGRALDAPYVEETLEILCRYGFAERRTFGDGAARYEHRHVGEHHDHMVCTACGGIFEFSDPKLEARQKKIAARNGFHLLGHRMELYGLCARCANERTAPHSLADARAGERLIIEGMDGGSGARLRLLAMGLIPGVRVEIISRINDGQTVLA